MKYSILIPAYKNRFFKECLESVLRQTVDDYEVIILNDCSPEPIEETVKFFNDDKIRYYKNEKNVGAANLVDNWNKLLSLAKGDYVACIGDDDKLAPDFLETYDVLIARFPDLDIYHARTIMIDEHSEPCNIQEERPEWESMYSMMWHQTFKGRAQYIGDFLFRRTALIARGGFVNLPYAMGSDWLIGYIMAQEKGIANLRKPTFYYRTSRYTITGNVPGKAIVEASLKYSASIKNLLRDKPVDPIDNLYRNCILSGYDMRSRRDIANNIATDLAASHFKQLFYWLRRRKELQLTVKDMIASILIGVYRMKSY